ncbi:gamma-tubulin complex component protein, partial [Ochromonadaceae sp. CCMP2298]
ALKKYLLLGQGDFVTCLMDGVGPELKRRANQLFRHNLTGILEGALRSSNAQFEPPYVADRIGIRLLEASPGDSGWEIFSLDYSIDQPLNAVVHPECIAKYRVAFHMLWRLKRVEWTLNSAWKRNSIFNHSHSRSQVPRSSSGSQVPQIPGLRAVLHRCHLNRSMMTHVVNNLCAFLMFEVMETAWVSLQDAISRAECLDHVIAAHDLYLSLVLDRALLAPQVSLILT